MGKEAHRYEYSVELDSTDAPARVIRLVGRNKRVLDLGGGPGSITRFLHQPGGCRITMLDLDAEAMERGARYCERVYQVDLDDPIWPRVLEGEGLFDVVVAADVLEHLRDPWTTLRTAVSLIGERGYLVVSLPHAGHSALVACMLDEDFDYRDTGLLDRTHIRFFGMRNIQELFEQAGLSIQEAEFVVRRPEVTELTDHWMRLPSELRRLLLSRPFGNVYQVVVKAAPRSRVGPGLSLLSQPVECSGGPLPDHIAAIGARLVRRFAPGARRRIYRLVNRLGLWR